MKRSIFIYLVLCILSYSSASAEVAMNTTGAAPHSSSNPNQRRFFVNGSAGGTTGWYNDSDLRLKKNIRPIDSPLEKVEKLNGVNFEWIDQLKKRIKSMEKEIRKH